MGFVARTELIVDFWDVGQGDATVIRLPDGKAILIDTGPKGSPVIDWLADKLPELHAVIVTHNDADHAGSLGSLVKMPGVRIETVYMLDDRDKTAKKFQDIWRPVREEQLKGRFAVRRLEVDAVTSIWEDNDNSLTVVYPDFAENLDSNPNRPNETSGVICLVYKGETKIIWPGDAPMRVVAEKCGGTRPDLLHGPHHGGPVDRKKARFRDWVQSLKPDRMFVSVGTTNGHSLPNPGYLEMQAERGCQITCSQLTRHCDPKHVLQEWPVIQTSALLGLRAPRSGVPCRGCFRLKVKNGVVSPDEFDTEHRKRIKGLQRPKCLLGSQS